MTPINQWITNGTGLSFDRERPPLGVLSLNHIQSVGATNIDPRILDDFENASHNNRRLSFGDSNLKQIAESLSLDCDPNVVYTPKSLNLPRTWIRYLHVVPVVPKKARASRDYYPLPEQQREFDEWEATRTATGSAEMKTFDLCSIPPDSEGGIPSIPLHRLIIAAINGAPSSMLTEREIKLALIRRFPYFAHRLAKNSRWQISVNWILNSYKCFERVTCKPTPGDDGCAYRVLEKGKELEVPVHALFPIGFDESIGNLSSKPNRAPRGPRLLSSSSASSSFSTDLAKILDLRDGDGPPSSSTSAVTLNSGDGSSPLPSEEESLPSRATSPSSLEASLGHLMIRPTGRMGEELTLRPILREGSVGVQNLPSLSDELKRLKRSWPDPTLDEPPVLPPCDIAGPSLWTQCLLFENVKKGSDRLAKQKLANSIAKRAQQFSK